MLGFAGIVGVLVWCGMVEGLFGCKFFWIFAQPNLRSVGKERAREPRPYGATVWSFDRTLQMYFSSKF